MVNWQREAKKYEWRGKGKDLPEMISAYFNESYAIMDESPVAFGWNEDGTIQFYLGEPVIEDGYMTERFYPPASMFALESDVESIFSDVEKLMGKKE